MAEIIIAFLTGLIGGVFLCVDAYTREIKKEVAAGVTVVDGKAYRITPMEGKSHD